MTAPAERRPPPRDLPEGYYLDNFEAVLRLVNERDRDLLSANDAAFLDDFARLPLAARRLWVRLVSRKGPVFRRDRLSYPEIPDLASAIDDAVDTGFVEPAPDLPIPEVLRRVRLGELRPLAASLLIEPSTGPTASTDDTAPTVPSGELPARKRDLVETLLARVPEAELQRALASRWSWIGLCRVGCLDAIRLLFFGNLRQDWTEFVLRDLGIQRYERVPLSRELRALPDRTALEHALELHRARDAQYRASERKDRVEVAAVGARLADRDDWHPSVRALAGRVYVTSGRAAERLGDTGLALELFGRSSVPPARERRARILEREGDTERALALAEEIAEGPRDETEAWFGPRFAHRLRRREDPSVPPLPRSRRRRWRLDLPPPDVDPGGDPSAGSPAHGGFPDETTADDPRTVEGRVLAWLDREGKPALFSENWLWTSLVGLAFWDVVFQPLPGAFLHPFQTGPRDLNDPEFRARRRDRIDARLEDLRGTDDLAPGLLTVWEEKRDTANRFVAWSDRAGERLGRALEWIRGPDLAVVADRMLRDVRRYRRGLPDLLVRREGASPGFELWELKGPGDALRPEQGAWIDHLEARGIPAAVVDVRW